MKKSLLFILASLIAIFALTGCADEPAKEEGSKVTPINLQDPSTLVGTYDVKFFGTVATQDGKNAFSAVSTDCSELIKSPLGKQFNIQATGFLGACETNTKLLGGKVTIKVDEVKHTLKIESKMQMIGQYFLSGVGMAGQSDTYQYTAYKEVSLDQVTIDGINSNGKVTGVSGRNLTSTTSNPKSTFKVTKLGEKDIFIDMELIEKKIGDQMTLNAPTNVKATKISNTAETLAPNSLFVTADQLTDPKEQEVFAKFVKEPK